MTNKKFIDYSATTIQKYVEIVNKLKKCESKVKTEKMIEKLCGDFDNDEMSAIAYVASVIVEGGIRSLDGYMADVNVPNRFKYSYIKNIEDFVDNKTLNKIVDEVANSLSANEDPCSYFNFINDFAINCSNKNVKYILPIMELEQEKHVLIDLGVYSYTATGIMKDRIQPNKDAPFNYIAIKADRKIKDKPLSEQLVKKAMGKKQNKDVIKYMKEFAYDYDVKMLDAKIENIADSMETLAQAQM
ncbi:MAG: hypothetical protein IJZ26_03245 [Clostridia bacterium]|nr:hypothetical protein [Clostridia bacterium]